MIADSTCISLPNTQIYFHKIPDDVIDNLVIAYFSSLLHTSSIYFTLYVIFMMTTFTDNILFR